MPIQDAPVGSKVWFVGEKRPYRIRARNDRYLVCTKPFNLLKTVIYTVVDLQEQVRGTEDTILCLGAETDAHCNAMLARMGAESEVSRRNRVPLNVLRISVSA